MKLRPPSRPRLRQQRPQIKLKASTARASARPPVPDLEEEELYEDEEGNTMKLSHAFLVVLILHLIALGGMFGFNYIRARQPGVVAQRASSSSSVARSTPSTRALASGAPSATQSSPSFRKENASQPVPPAAPPTATARAIDDSSMLPELPTSQKVPRAPGKNSPVAASSLQAPKVPLYPPRTAPKAASLPNPSVKTTAKIPATSPKALPLAKLPEAIHGAKGPVTKQKGHAIYHVVKGDNPYSIARRFKMSYTQLLSYNKVLDPTKLQIGAQLKLPPQTP